MVEKIQKGLNATEQMFQQISLISGIDEDRLKRKPIHDFLLLMGTLKKTKKIR